MPVFLRYDVLWRTVQKELDIVANDAQKAFSGFVRRPRDVRGDGDTFDVEQWTVGKHGFYAQDINACA